MSEGLFANSRELKATQARGIECGQDYRHAPGPALTEARGGRWAVLEIASDSSHTRAALWYDAGSRRRERKQAFRSRVRAHFRTMACERWHVPEDA